MVDTKAVSEVAKALLAIISDPNVQAAVGTLIVLVGGALGLKKNSDVMKAGEMLADGKTVSEITDKTKLVVSEVQAIHAEIKTPEGVVDTNKKKFSRGLRAFVKGFLLK